MEIKLGYFPEIENAKLDLGFGLKQYVMDAWCDSKEVHVKIDVGHGSNYGGESISYDQSNRWYEYLTRDAAEKAEKFMLELQKSNPQEIVWEIPTIVNGNVILVRVKLSLSEGNILFSIEGNEKKIVEVKCDELNSKGFIDKYNALLMGINFDIVIEANIFLRRNNQGFIFPFINSQNACKIEISEKGFVTSYLIIGNVLYISHWRKNRASEVTTKMYYLPFQDVDVAMVLMRKTKVRAFELNSYFLNRLFN